MPELRVSALLSDMDGVLVDTGGIYDRHWERWAARHGVSAARIAALHFGRAAAETIRLVAPDLDPVAEARLFNDALAEDAATDGVLALPGALALAAALPAERWAICTSATRVMAERWLAHIGIARPAVMVTVDDVARGKPAPDPYLRAAELLGRPAEACLVIEDAPAGITAARAAGATVLAVQTTHQPADLVDAHHLVGGLDDLTIGADDDGVLIRWN